jgi:hypothetical protein
MGSIMAGTMSRTRLSSTFLAFVSLCILYSPLLAVTFSDGLPFHGSRLNWIAGFSYAIRRRLARTGRKSFLTVFPNSSAASPISMAVPISKCVFVRSSFIRNSDPSRRSLFLRHYLMRSKLFMLPRITPSSYWSRLHLATDSKVYTKSSDNQQSHRTPFGTFIYNFSITSAIHHSRGMSS